MPMSMIAKREAGCPSRQRRDTSGCASFWVRPLEGAHDRQRQYGRASIIRREDRRMTALRVAACWTGAPTRAYSLYMNDRMARSTSHRANCVATSTLIALTCASVAMAQSPPQATTARIDSVMGARITSEKVFFVSPKAPDTVRALIAYDRRTGAWTLIDSVMKSANDIATVSASDDSVRVAPGWKLHGRFAASATDPQPYLKSDTSATRYPVRVTLSAATRRELERTWGVTKENPLSPFSRSVASFAVAGDYIWLGLEGGAVALGDADCSSPNDACVHRAGGVVQFNTRTRAMRFLLPPALKDASAAAMAVADGHLWIAAETEIVRYRIIPDTGVRPSPVDSSYPRDRIRALDSDGSLIALVTDAGVAVASGGAAAMSSRWFVVDDAADTTLVSLSATALTDDSLWSDSPVARAYKQRRGIRVLMDGLGLPLARRPAFRAAAGRLHPSRFLDFYEAYMIASGIRGADLAFLAGAEEAAGEALADTVFLPFLVAQLGMPDVAQADFAAMHRGVALDAMIRIPDGSGRGVVAGVLDTLRDPAHALRIATRLAAAKDARGQQWMLERIRDREHIAREIAAQRYGGYSPTLAAAYNLRDTTFAGAMLDLLKDPRLARHVLGPLTAIAMEQPALWRQIAVAAGRDSSLGGRLVRESHNPGVLSDPVTRRIVQDFARRMVRLPADTVERARFALDVRADVDLVAGAVRALVRYRDGSGIPDLVRLLRDGNPWDFDAAAHGLVNLTGNSAAPALRDINDQAQVARVRAYWSAWLARTRAPFPVVAADIGERAEAAYRRKP